MPTVDTNADVNESSAYRKRKEVLPTLEFPERINYNLCDMFLKNKVIRMTFTIILLKSSPARLLRQFSIQSGLYKEMLVLLHIK